MTNKCLCFCIFCVCVCVCVCVCRSGGWRKGENQWRIQRGIRNAPSFGPNSFIFKQFSANIWQNNRFFALISGVGASPLGNPGSATGHFLSRLKSLPAHFFPATRFPDRRLVCVMLLQMEHTHTPTHTDTHTDTHTQTHTHTPGGSRGGAASEAKICEHSQAESCEWSKRSRADSCALEAFEFLMLKYAFFHILETHFLSLLAASSTFQHQKLIKIVLQSI